VLRRAPRRSQDFTPYPLGGDLRGAYREHPRLRDADSGEEDQHHKDESCDCQRPTRESDQVSEEEWAARRRLVSDISHPNKRDSGH
jgi:hypothetical protein